MSESTVSSSRMGSSPVPLATNRPQNRINIFELPNIPNPINGMIKTYDTSHRSFTRPYSAKTVFFYKEGDHYFTGLRVPVSKARYRNMDSLLDDLNVSIPMPFGVRRLHTPYGRTPIQNLDQLQHLGKYVVSSSKYGKPLDIDAVDKHQQRMREIARKRWEKLNQTPSTSSFPSSRYNGGFRKSFGLFLPMTAKQLFFVLNGHPGRIYRIVLSPYRKTDLETVLEEVSQGLEIAIVKIYTFSGDRISNMDQLINLKESRVLAVPRHEKPILPSGILKEGSITTSNSTVTSLPPINRNFYKHHEKKENNQHTVLASIKPKINFNGRSNHSIERRFNAPRPPVPLGPPRRTFNYRHPQTFNSLHRVSRVAPPAIPYSKSNQNRRVTSLKPRRNLSENSETKSPNSVHSSVSAENDSDSGRPRSTDFEEDGKEGRSTRSSEESDYPEAPVGLSDGDSIQSPPPSRASNIEAKTPSDMVSDDEESSGPESPKSEDSRKRKAAVTIQAYTRGHLTRKKLKTRPPTPGPQSFNPITESDDEYSESEQSEHFTDEENEDYPDYSEPEQSEHFDDEIDKENAAIIIQKNFRGYLVRKKLSEKRESPKLETIEEGIIDTDEEEEHPTRLDSAFSKDHVEEETLSDETMTYLVRIFTGNRWAADTETDLYIILHGDDGESEKRILQQDSENPKFVQGQVDDFLVMVPSVGRLRKITLGHEHKGYGGGIFIDQVIVVEGGNSGRQYLFQCFKWFDSGQVDGKLERTVKCTALYYSATASERKSQGRWELILHNGTKDGQGGTSSNLNIFGYSHDVMSRSVDIYDNTLAVVPSTSLVQVDFGQELANLTKIRIEIDGNGDKPDYYLDYVELMDLDTEERMEVTVEKWLKWESEEKGAQAFRELVIFRGAADTLPLCTYEGKLRILVHKIPLCNPNVKIELFGENGESGIFPVSIANKENKKDKYDVSFRIEAANLGRFIGIRMYFDPTETGEAIYDGLGEVQRMFTKHSVENSVGDDFIIQHALIRESTHTPYRMVLEHSRIVPRRDEEDSFVKELRTSRMEGLSTKLSKKSKLPKKKPPTWVVSMLIDDQSTLLPEVTLCGADGTDKMQCLDTSPTDNIVGYQMKNAEIGELRKIRVAVDRKQRLNVLPEENTDPKNRVYIKKIRVIDAVNGDEVRFPAAKIELLEYSVVEFPAIWPDIQPMDGALYEVTISSGKSIYTGPFYVHFNLIGEFGDTGSRYLGEPDASNATVFESDSQKTFQLEAVSIGEVQKIEAFVEAPGNEDFTWECQEVVVSDPDTGLFFAFHFNEPFTPTRNRQKSEVSPFTSAL